MDDLGPLLTTIFGITTIIAAAIAGLVWGTVKTLRESNGDLRHRVDDLVKEIDATETKYESCQAELQALRGEHEALLKVVTGQVHWEALTNLLVQHHEESKQAWQGTRNEMTSGLTKVSDALRLLSEQPKTQPPSVRRKQQE